VYVYVNNQLLLLMLLMQDDVQTTDVIDVSLDQLELNEVSKLGSI